MRHLPDYVTPERRQREERYRRRLCAAAAAAVLLHAVLIVAVQPFRDEIPLVRRIGYRGALRIMPEISVLREISEEDSEIESTAGGIGGSGFRVVDIELVDWALPEGAETDLVEEQAMSEMGDDLLSALEASLPQPMSTDMVVVKLVEPRYPASSLEAGVEGVVTFRLHVSKTGEVRRAWLMESEVDDACNLEAYRAVIQWLFSPYRIDGEATPILVDQRIRFRIRDELRDARGS